MEPSASTISDTVIDTVLDTDTEAFHIGSGDEHVSTRMLKPGKRKAEVDTTGEMAFGMTEEAYWSKMGSIMDDKLSVTEQK